MRVPPVPVFVMCARLAAHVLTVEKIHIRTLTIAAATAAVLALSSTAFAQGQGTADEAKAMLAKTVTAIKADKVKTLDLINKGEGGFLDRDLYSFCSNVSDGKTVAIGNPNAKQVIGVDARTLKDTTGKPFGQELYDAYQKPEGQITEVSYMWVRPGPDKTPVAKVSFATRVGDLGCGVGYYK
jgi:Single Cache domain 2